MDKKGGQLGTGASGSQAADVKRWLDEIGCIELFDAFAQKNYTDLETIAMHLNKRDLEVMGANRAQIQKILSGADKLRDTMKETIGKGVMSISFLALRKVVGSKEDDLSFEKGDDVIVIERTSSERWKGRANGKEGYFPPNAILAFKETPCTSAKDTETRESSTGNPVKPSKLRENVEPTALLTSTDPNAYARTLDKSALEQSATSEFKSPGAGTPATHSPAVSNLAAGCTQVPSNVCRAKEISNNSKDREQDKCKESCEDKKSSTTGSAAATEKEKSETVLKSLSHSDKSDNTSHQGLERTKEIPQGTHAVSLSTDEGGSKKPKSSLDGRSNNQERQSAQLKAPLTKAPVQKGIKVEFHILIHPEWGFDSQSGHSVGILFAHPWLGEWKVSPVTMQAKERGANEYIRLQGVLELPPALKSKALSYKYVVQRNSKTCAFEYIKQPSLSKSKVVNRVLEIPKHVQDRAKGLYRKYDDVIRQEQGLLKAIWEKLIGSPFVENRTVAIEMLLPKLSEFFGSGEDSDRQMTAEEALYEVDHVIQSIRYLRVWEDKLPSPHSWDLQEFSDNIVSKALQKHLKAHLRSFAKWKGEHSVDSDAVVSSLVVAILIQKYKLELTTDVLAGILNAMTVLPDLDDHTCPRYQLLNVEFTDSSWKEKAIAAVLYLCQKACSSGSFSTEWLLALPLLHFLRGESEPFQAPAVMAVNTPKWWGLDSLYDNVKGFRNVPSNRKSALALVDRLQPLFHVDPLSSRAFLFVISLEQMATAKCEQIAKPFEVIQVLEEKVINEKQPSWFTGSYNPIKWLQVVVESLVKQCLDSDVESGANIEVIRRNAKSGIVTSVNLLRTVTSKFTEADHFKAILQCRDLILAMMKNLSSLPIADDEHQEIDKQLQRAFRYVEEWLARRTFTRTKDIKDIKSLAGDLMLWSNFLQSRFLEGRLEKQWSDLFESSLTKQLLSVEPLLLMASCSQMAVSDLHQTVQKCYDFASETLADLLTEMRTSDLEILIQSLISGVKKPAYQERTAKNLGLALRKTCPFLKAPTVELLTHLLNWKMWKDLFHFANDFPQAKSVLGSNFGFIERAKTKLSMVVDQLANSTITVEELRVVNELRTNFMNLCSQVDSMKKRSRLHKVAEASLHLRNEELVEFRRQIELVNIFVAMCSVLDLGASPELDRLSRAAKAEVSKQPIKALCIRENSKQIRVCYFIVPQDFVNLLERLQCCHGSSVFKRFWRRQGEEVRKQWQESKQIATLSNIASSLCEPVFTQWQNLCKSVFDESVTIGDVSNTFCEFLCNRTRLEGELRCIHICHNSSGNDSWISERATQMEMIGKFRKIMDAAKAMKEVSEVLMITQRMKEVESICSQDSGSFGRLRISYLRGKFISTGQQLDSVTENQVRCLQSFASARPLITWLKKEIKEWNELESFVELAGTKLSGEGDYEAVKVAHLRGACAGYVHLLFDVGPQATFLELFEACTKVFECLQRDPQLPTKWVDTAQNLEDFKYIRASLSSFETSAFTDLELINWRGEYQVGCVQSRISTTEEYTTENCIRVKIVAVQSKRAATGKVYWFTELADIQSRLMLICGENNKSKNEVKFFLEVLNRAVRLADVFIKLRKSGHCNFLKWNKVFRSREARRASSLHKDGLPALSIEQETSDSSLLQSLTKEANNMEESLEQWSREVDQHRTRFYHLNYFTAPQVLVLRRELGALLVNHRHQVPNNAFCLLWSAAPGCTTQTLRDTLSAVTASAYDSRSPTRQRSEMNVQIVPGLASERPLYYLEMNTLGRLLEKLSSFSCSSPKRPFPSEQFTLGEINLVAVPRKDVLVSVLHLYMIDNRLPLPTTQEVLLCSQSTSAEEVCLFWRRALGDPGHRRLYCLAMADRLSYEVSKATVEFFNLLVQKQDAREKTPFKVAIVCAAESDSYILNAFEAYRRHALPCVSFEHLQRYLKQKFHCSMDASFGGLGVQPLKPAAMLDHEHSSVRVVRSSRAGVGKSLFISQLAECLSKLPNNFGANSLVPLHIVVPLHDRKINLDSVLNRLVPCSPSPDTRLSRIIHIDVSPLVHHGLEDFLFSLLILGEISDTRGQIWHKMPTDLYIVEITTVEQIRRRQTVLAAFRRLFQSEDHAFVSFIDCMPNIGCVCPSATYTFMSKKTPLSKGSGLNDREYRNNSNFQRAFQYLRRFSAGENMDSFKFRVGSVEGDHQSCLQVLLQNCGVRNPSWSEINYFVSFLGSQLRDFENNDFCNPEAYGEDLPGFKAFVMKLLIRMSRDFSTPSLDMERSSVGEERHDLGQYEIRRHWEQSSHPYLLFNDDRHSITFVGVQINRDGHLLDPQTGNTLDTQMMTRDLSTALYTQGFRLQENYDAWDKRRKIEELSRVMGVNAVDHDENYELTMDNVKKILAIQMRFRCGIPVVIMGETGCGKTRLIRYMCSLQANRTGAKNMLLMKVHGGITKEDIIKIVQEAEKLAATNKRVYGQRIQTVLFFDEANTTDALGLIKEIMCDKRANGRKISELGISLQVIAACNPYRKHTEGMIRHLEGAGLGYHVTADRTEDRLGQIPLRQLVYRVHPLPESMQALVWDFGRLDENIEKLYIKQIVSRYIERRQSLPNTPGLVDVIANILAAAQTYMRNRNDECSFVSLRDVERAMLITVRFYNLQPQLGPLMRSKEHLPGVKGRKPLYPLTSSLVLGLAVSYHARLKEREVFREVVSKEFREPCGLPGGADRMYSEIRCCQEVFLDAMKLEPQIARNQALSENVFMMMICIDLRIPLFIVGKPGSSKSLAKDIVRTNMTGHFSHSVLLRSFKQFHMVTYQCSPQSSSEGIIGTFQQCQNMQKDDNIDHFVACVVLDEVGLAEDSPRLPLKALHPLLDDGTSGADCPQEESRSNRVAFVGLSNWALDPAKMNRGILVNREEPNDAELISSAKGICSSNDETLHLIMPYLEGMAKAYRQIYEQQRTKTSREFFGLRDFYSLVKMAFAFCERSQRAPSPLEMEHAIRRNFGGQEEIDVVAIFNRCCTFRSHVSDPQAMPFAINNTTIGLIQSALESGQARYLGESRYLLLLTENHAALNIIRQKVVLRDDPLIIFGSPFPKDQEYTHICRTINRIKVCMESGRTVVLLNLEKLYESLYDTLNQYYVRHGGQKFVNLGLGSHRVKCKVHEDFRLILVAERDDVYQHFPIPLINRMEKHFLAMKSVLSPDQQQTVERLHTWVSRFSLINPGDHLLERQSQSKIGFREGDAFIGYHRDTIATVVLKASVVLAQKSTSDQDILSVSRDTAQEQLFEMSCQLLLSCATPDSIARLPVSKLSAESDRLRDIYFSKQYHGSLREHVKHQIATWQKEKGSGLLLQITTHSRPLSSEILKGMISFVHVEFVSLEQFDTEQQFCDRLKSFYEGPGLQSRLLVIQYIVGDRVSDTVASVRYLVQEIRKGKVCGGPKHLCFILHIPRVAGGCFVGFQAGSWIEAHLDELRPESHFNILSVKDMLNRRMSSLLSENLEEEEEERRHLLAQVSELCKATESEVQSRSRTKAAISTGTDSIFGSGCKVLSGSAVIGSCIHDAVSRLDLREEGIDNASQTVCTLLKLMPNKKDSKCQIFFKEMLRRVRKLLEERDEQIEASSADLWVRNEALSHRSIQAGGTFRRTLWLRIIEVVTPVLSEVIALIDCNSNLRLLSGESGKTVEGEKWLSTLWLDLFRCPQFTQLHYDDLHSPVQGEMRKRVPVQSHGFRGHPFEAQFPFSHFVKTEIDEMFQEARSIAESTQERTDIVLGRLFDSSSIGEIVLKALANGGANNSELVERYLNDFVHMVYNAGSEEEHTLIQSAVVCGLNEIAAVKPAINETSGKIAHPALSLASIHVAFDYIRRRIYSFGEIVRHRAALVLRVKRQVTTKSSEMVADALAALVLVDELCPNGKLQDSTRRNDWLKRIQKVKGLVDSWLLLCGGTTEVQVVRTAIKEDIRSKWAVLTALRLYIEHVQPLLPDPLISSSCSKLYLCLHGTGGDFTKENSLKAVQRFLDDISKQFASRLIGQSHDQCAICRDSWTGKDPVSLECRHVFCCVCISTCITQRRSCPVCQKELSKRFSCVPDKKLKAASETYTKFKRCSTAFFMEIVSVFSFSETAPIPPEPGLVHMLMEMVVQRRLRGDPHTRPFSPFPEDAIDSRPVVRSFILQLLLKYSTDQSVRYIEQVFAEAQTVLGARKTEDMESLEVIFVQCMEDALEKQAGRDSAQDHFGRAQLELDAALKALRGPSKTVQTLQGIASARFGLSITADVIGSVLTHYGETSKEHEGNRYRASSLTLNSHSVRKLLSKAEEVCSGVGDQQLLLFLVKRLVRCYGMDIMQAMREDDRLRWICAIDQRQEVEREQSVPDFFVIMQSPYLEIRQALAVIVNTNESKPLDELLKKLESKSKSTMVASTMLALFKEVTISRSFRDPDREVLPRTLDVLEKYFKGNRHFPAWSKALATDLIRNTLGRPLNQLRVAPGQSIQHRALSGLALHIFIALNLCGQNNILKPLHLMLTEPHNMTKSYFPTMPEDILMEAQAVVQGTKWYQCKNGHPYLVGECGRPTMQQRCTDCGVLIGERSGDIGARTDDTTQTGHVLGYANRRCGGPTSERDLSPSGCSLLRMLLHAALLWASLSQDQRILSGLEQCVSPAIRQNDLPGFFWSHFELDTVLLAKSIGRSMEDTVVVCHQLLNGLVTNQGNQYEFRESGRLSTRQERRSWERECIQKIISPLLQSMQNYINDWLHLVITDQSSGNNALLRKVYELVNLQDSRFSPKLWRYRISVSIDHLIHSIENSKDAAQPNQLELLKAFLKEEPKLRALKFLPDIIELQHLFVTKYHRRISKKEALEIDVGSFLAQIPDLRERQMFDSLINSFANAWSLLKDTVLSYGRLKPKKQEHELHSVTQETPLAFLLPQPQKEGTCAASLVDYLINCTHNEFLGTYRRIVGQEGDIERVPMEEVTKAQLVVYDVERDLMPLVFAHCDYSLAVGEGTKITYNLQALERQIIDRFLVGKPHVDMKVYRVAFRKEAYTVALFDRVRQRVIQEEIPIPVQRQVVSELQDITDLYHVLGVLDTVIGFMASSGGKVDTTLDHYIHNTLQMPMADGICSPKAKQFCQLKHVLALWRLLTIEKGRRLALAEQEPFEHVPNKYRELIPPLVKKRLRATLRKINLEAFLTELVEVIMLELGKWEEENKIEEYELSATLQELHGSELAYVDDIPTEVQLKHIIHCWCIAVEVEEEIAGRK